MIKLFKRVRQKLLSQKKFKNYLLYAVGEIILVVIGILIALWLNNLNESRKNKKYEIQYLKGIHANLEKDVKELEDHFWEDTLKLNAYTYLVNVFADDSESINFDEVLPHIYNTFAYNWFEGQNHVFDDMRSSGKLNLIHSDNIKQEIQRYYKLFDEVLKQEEIHNAEIRKHMSLNSKYFNASSLLEPTFDKKWNAMHNMPKKPAIMNAQINPVDLINNYSVMKTYQNANRRVRQKLYKESKDLIELIEGYID